MPYGKTAANLSGASDDGAGEDGGGRSVASRVCMRARASVAIRFKSPTAVPGCT